ncbi:hypothetical protein CVO96_16970 [Deinococcus koreensis]|uniref:Uncharacterized protein n=1 Tax=Deinococcus koreensis TaxID=2054903 RepID=A0A2K3USZ7_9DEIO|nr:hypothetical protein CVO96_16970 [Deinococcus koreensis]
MGVLSAVDIGALPESRQEAGRGPGLSTVLPGAGQVMPQVELIHLKHLAACKASGAAASKKCPQYEWSVPFISEAYALAMEEALSRAWNTFDARSTWYMNSLLNAKPDPGIMGAWVGQLSPLAAVSVAAQFKSLAPSTQGRSFAANCGPNANARVDRYLNAWDGGDLVASPLKSDQFCSGLQDAISAAVPSYFPGAQCTLIDLPQVTNWAEVSRRYAAGYQQAVSVFYPQYWKEVYEAIETYMPGSLAWDGVYPLSGAAGTSGGVQLQPVYATGRRPLQYRALAQKAQAKKAGGAAYILKNYPYPGLAAPASASAGLAVPRLPGGATGTSWPGIPTLEVLKYGLSQREDIFSRADQWWGAQPAPQGPTGAGDLRETEGVGAVGFMQLFSQVDRLTSPRTVEYQRWCFMSYAPPVLTLVTRTLPNISTGINTYLGGITRVHVRWETAPEGYPLHHVRGQPSRGTTLGLMNLAERLPVLKLPKIDVTTLPSTQKTLQDKAVQAAAAAASQSSTVTAPPAPTPANTVGSPPKPTPTPTSQGTARTVTGCESAGGEQATVKCLARKVLDNPNIALNTSSTTSGGSPRQNIVDAINGVPAARGCGPTTPNCGQREAISPKLLTAMLALARQGSYRVTAITGGGHKGNSSHYTGEALDIGTWDGVLLNVPNAGHKRALEACLAADARSGYSLNAFNDPAHKDHVHCDFR